MNPQLKACLEQLRANEREAISGFLLQATGEPRPFALYRHAGATLDAAGRKKLLERVRAGEQVDLQVEAVTYIQRDTPNRNFVRFKDGALRTIAKSGVGSPFLRNHDQRDVLARGGTILASQGKKNESGEWEFHQEIDALKLWAVEGLLDGTLDRFSIGWLPTGEIHYRHNDQDIFEGGERFWPAHWPGDVLKDGTVVEWVFQKAELIETSAVNVPGVVGTHIKGLDALQEFHAVLSAAGMRGNSPPSTKQQHTEDTVSSFKRLLQALGLSADASEESALAVVEQRELELRAEKEAHDKTTKTLKETNDELAVFRKRDEEAKAAELDASIGQLYTEGKLVRSAGPKGEAQPDAYEATLREVHSKLGAKSFAAAAARLVANVPVGKQADAEDPSSANEGGEVIVLTARHKEMIAQIGMTEEQYTVAMKRGGKF